MRMTRDNERLLRSVEIAPGRRPAAAVDASPEGPRRRNRIALEASLKGVIDNLVASGHSASRAKIYEALHNFLEEKFAEKDEHTELQMQSLRADRNRAYQEGFDAGCHAEANRAEPVPVNLPITREQCAAARALVGCTQQQLADAAGVSLSCVSDFESAKRPTRDSSIRRMREALERGHIQFIVGEQHPFRYSAGCGVRYSSYFDEVRPFSSWRIRGPDPDEDDPLCTGYPE